LLSQPNSEQLQPLATYLIPIRRARIINHDIQFPKLLVRELDNVLPVLSLRHVRSHELALELVGSLLSDFFNEVRDDHACALLDELGCDAFAKTAAAASDDCDFVVEFALGHGGCGLGLLCLFGGLGSVASGDLDV
jgi:hypothetical protein